MADKLTDKEIIKALECCGTATCISNSCPYEKIHDIPTCTTKLTRDALDLINRQQAELEDARIGVKSYKGKYESAVKTARELQTLVDEQQAEIERLSKKNEELAEILSDTIRIRYAECKSEAIKEFADRVKDDSWFTDLFDRNDYPVRAVTKEDIDNLVKEMVGK